MIADAVKAIKPMTSERYGEERGSRLADVAALCSRTSGEDYAFSPSTMLVPKLSCSGITLVTRNPVSA